MKIIGVFSGGGGLSEGFRKTEKFQFVCHVEKEASACLTLQLRNIYYYLKSVNRTNEYKDFLEKKTTLKELFQSVPNQVVDNVLNYEINDDSLNAIYEYIDKNLQGSKLDGIIGGPPCQAYSLVGRAKNKHRKATDKRIYLYQYYLSFLEKYQPNFFVFENVKGLLSFKDEQNKSLFPIILESFNSAGYSVSKEIVNSEDYGVSQKRERLFIVGIKNDVNVKQDFFKVLESYKEKAPNISELFEDLPDIKSGEGSNEYKKGTLNEAVKIRYRKPETDVLTQHIARPHNENDLAIYKIVAEAKNNGINLNYNDLPEELKTHSNTKSFLDRFKALDAQSVSHTVVAHIAKDGHYYIHPDIKQNRSISVREAARIQGFPDNYCFPSSRTATLTQIGNAVPPILAEKIANTILDLFNDADPVNLTEQ